MRVRSGSVVWDLSCGTFRLGPFAWDRSLSICRLDSFAWDYSFGVLHCFLRVMAMCDLSCGILRLKLFVWACSLGNFCLRLPLGILSWESFVWGISDGIFLVLNLCSCIFSGSLFRICLVNFQTKWICYLKGLFLTRFTLKGSYSKS